MKVEEMLDIYRAGELDFQMESFEALLKDCPEVVKGYIEENGAKFKQSIDLAAHMDDTIRRAAFMFWLNVDIIGHAFKKLRPICEKIEREQKGRRNAADFRDRGPETARPRDKGREGEGGRFLSPPTSPPATPPPLPHADSRRSHATDANTRTQEPRSSR